MASRCCRHSQGHLLERPSPSAQCPRSCMSRYVQGVFAEPLGAGFPKPARNAPASTGKPVRRAGRLGVCPAGIGRYRGSLAVSSCPHCWPGLLDQSHARRHSLQVGKTVTSRDCGATVATERSGGGGGGGSSSRPPWPVPTRVLQTSPPSLIAARVVAWPCLDRLSAHRTGQPPAPGAESVPLGPSRRGPQPGPRCPRHVPSPAARLLLRWWRAIADERPSAGIGRGAGIRKGSRSRVQPSPARSTGLELCYWVFSFDV